MNTIKQSIDIDHKISLSNDDTVAACEEIADTIRKMDIGELGESSGLYLLTPDAGIQASVAFWTEANTLGPGFVGPRLFPFTLANSPASCLARELNIKGPCVTLVGDENSRHVVDEMVEDDIKSRRVKKALVVYLSLNKKEAIVGYRNDFYYF